MAGFALTLGPACDNQNNESEDNDASGGGVTASTSLGSTSDASTSSGQGSSATWSTSGATVGSTTLSESTSASTLDTTADSGITDETSITDTTTDIEGSGTTNESSGDDGGCPMGEAEWDYAKHGPDSWGDLHCDWQLCRDGREQSPIDIPGRIQPSADPELVFDYVPSGVHLAHRGQLLAIEYDPGSQMHLDGRSYELKEIVYHAGSEHSIAGGFAPMELQLYHQAADGSVVIVAVFVEVGGGHPALQLLASLAPEEAGERFDDEEQFLSAEQFIPSRREHYEYRGSLSTPPCSENVTWLVMARSIKAADGEMTSLSEAFRGHRRPVMPLNNRTVIGGGT